MKNILTSTLMILLCCSTVIAQNADYKNMAGAGFSLTDDTEPYGGKRTILNIEAKVGFALGKSIKIGPVVSYQSQSNPGTSMNAKTLGVFIRPYFQNFFFELSGSYYNESYNNSIFGPSSSADLALIGAGMGYAFFVNDYVAIEPMIEFNRFESKTAQLNRLGFKIGFQYYFGGDGTKSSQPVPSK